LAKVMHSLATTAGRWRQIHRSRRDLMRLSPYLLDDIGLDRQTCEDEARQPFWKV
jgi:uncharacterized protein YjiS (DUF1127 family)